MSVGTDVRLRAMVAVAVGAVVGVAIHVTSEPLILLLDDAIVGLLRPDVDLIGYSDRPWLRPSLLAIGTLKSAYVTYLAMSSGLLGISSVIAADLIGLAGLATYVRIDGSLNTAYLVAFFTLLATSLGGVAVLLGLRALRPEIDRAAA